MKIGANPLATGAESAINRLGIALSRLFFCSTRVEWIEVIAPTDGETWASKWPSAIALVRRSSWHYSLVSRYIRTVLIHDFLSDRYLHGVAAMVITTESYSKQNELTLAMKLVHEAAHGYLRHKNSYLARHADRLDVELFCVRVEVRALARIAKPTEWHYWWAYRRTVLKAARFVTDPDQQLEDAVPRPLLEQATRSLQRSFEILGTYLSTPELLALSENGAKQLGRNIGSSH